MNFGKQQSFLNVQAEAISEANSEIGFFDDVYQTGHPPALFDMFLEIA